jgi:hypothetical protein
MEWVYTPLALKYKGSKFILRQIMLNLTKKKGMIFMKSN